MAANPVRVKLYGMFWMTKRRYVAQLVVAGLLSALLLGVWWFRWRPMRDELPALSSPALNLMIGFWDLAPYIVLVILALQAIEAFFVFRAFARKQSEAPALAPAPAAPPPPPPAP